MSSQERWEAVDAYLEGSFIGDDPVLAYAQTASDEAGLPPIAVAPTQGKMLQILALAIGARSILEIGTLGGYSTIWLARGLAPGGRLVTLELDPKHAKIARGNLDQAGVSEVVDIRVGPAVEALAQLVDEGSEPFDLVFIDADKASYPEYLDWSLRLTRPGSLIVADNVVRNGGVIDPDNDDINVQGARRFNELVSQDPRVIATAIQTVGVKGWDGFSLALVAG